MLTRIRLILATAVLAFGLASLVHAGILFGDFEHSAAATAEGVIAIVVIVGLLGTFARSASARGIAFAALGFALLGTLVGAFTIAVGVGPQSTPDILFHGLLVVGLVAGLVVTWRMRRIG